MLAMAKRKSNLLDSVAYQNAGPKMNFLSIFTHARDRCFFYARVCYRSMAVIIKAMHTPSTHNILLKSLLSDV